MQVRSLRWLTLVMGTVVLVTGVELALRVRYRHRVLPSSVAGDAGVVLVALGDSITAGAPGDRAEAWPAQLEKRLSAAYPHVRWRLVNAGVSGDTAPLGYHRFDSDVSAHGPDGVLIAFGLNDCNPARYGLDLWLERQVPDGLARSFLWRAVAVRLQRLAGRLRGSTAPQVEQGLQPWPRTSLPGYTKTLAALVERARLLGAHPVLLTMTPLAETQTPQVEARRSLYPAYNDAIKGLAARAGVPLVRLDTGAPPAAFMPDGVHLTAVGQAWVADRVFRQLDAQGFWAQLAHKGGGK